MTEKTKAAISNYRRQCMIGRVKKMLDAGLTTSEICEKLEMSESEIRPVMEVIEKAERNRKLMEATNE